MRAWRGVRLGMLATAALAAAACGMSPAADRAGLGSGSSGLLPPPVREEVAGAALRLLLVPMGLAAENEGPAAAELERFVEGRTGLRLETTRAATYEEVEEAVAAGRTDAALLSPLLYVRMADRFARDPALRGVRLRLLLTAVAGGSPTYLGYVVAAADSGMDDLGDVAGRPFGMVEGSTSGYLYPMDLADARGLDPARTFCAVRFYPRHPDMLADLLRPAGERSIEAGAFYQHLIDALGPVDRARLRILAKTARIPRDAMVVRVPLAGGVEDRRTLAVASALQHALLEMDHDATAAAALRAGIGHDGWIVGDDRRYDAIRRVGERFGHYRLGAEVGATGPGEARSR